MEQNRTLLGIGFMLLFCTLAPLGDALAKILGQTVALGPLIFIRFAIQVIILAPMALAIWGSWHFSGKFLTLSAIRTVLQITGIAIMVVALQYLPLADAVAIVFILPLLVILLGWAVLKEDVSKERLLACVVGFVGTLMVIQPSFQEVGFYAVLPLLVAFIFAIFMLITRFITQENDVIKVQTVNGVMAVALIAPALLIFKDGSVPLFDFSTISSDKIIFVDQLWLCGNLCLAQHDLVSQLSALGDYGAAAISGNPDCHLIWLAAVFRTSEPTRISGHCDNDGLWPIRYVPRAGQDGAAPSAAATCARCNRGRITNILAFSG